MILLCREWMLFFSSCISQSRFCKNIYNVFSKFLTPNLFIYRTFLWHSRFMFFTFTLLPTFWYLQKSVNMKPDLKFVPVIWNSYSKFCLIVFEVGFISILRYYHGAMNRSLKSNFTRVFSCYLSGLLPDAWHTITINKMCWVKREIKHFLPLIFTYFFVH